MFSISEITPTPEQLKKLKVQALTDEGVKKLINFYEMNHDDEWEEFKRNLLIQMKLINLKLKNGQLTRADKEATHFLNLVKSSKGIKSGWDAVFNGLSKSGKNKVEEISVRKSMGR